MILAGDIGGTKVNLAYYNNENGALVPVLNASYPSQKYGSLNEVLHQMHKDHPAQVTAAAFGIAGPVLRGRSVLTNLKWEIVGEDIRKEFNYRAVGLLNDLEAMAYGVLHLQEADQAILQRGKPVEHAAISIIAAGTGLGEGALVWNGSRYQAVPSEGGHSDFAARNDLEVDLLKFLTARHGHVSWERILSGPGLFSLYEFLRLRSGIAEPSWLKDTIASGDPSAAVSRAGMEGKDTVCSQALDLFVALYGAEAGNLVLKFFGTAGIFIGGGIAPKILARMQSGLFMDSFVAKGRFRETMKGIPVSIIVNERSALLGAAHYASVITNE